MNIFISVTGFFTLFSGAQCVLFSLWPIPPGASKIFMKQFYTSLLQVRHHRVDHIIVVMPLFIIVCIIMFMGNIFMGSAYISI